jgi:hypothetical protein
VAITSTLAAEYLIRRFLGESSALRGPCSGEVLPVTDLDLLGGRQAAPLCHEGRRKPAKECGRSLPDGLHEIICQMTAFGLHGQVEKVKQENCETLLCSVYPS